MITTYNIEPETTLHPLDDAILKREFATDPREKALAALAIQHIWTNFVTVNDFAGNTQVIHRGQE